MTLSELFSAVNSDNPIQPVIRMLEGVDIFEDYLEAGMAARVVGADHDGDDVIGVDLVLTEFDEYNRQFETSCYYDENGTPCLTARESGNYSERMKVFIDTNLDLSGIFELLGDNEQTMLVDPKKTFNSSLRVAQGKRPSELSSYSLANVNDLALHLFIAGDNASPLAIATRGYLKSLSNSENV